MSMGGSRHLGVSCPLLCLPPQAMAGFPGSNQRQSPTGITKFQSPRHTLTTCKQCYWNTRWKSCTWLTQAAWWVLPCRRRGQMCPARRPFHSPAPCPPLPSSPPHNMHPPANWLTTYATALQHHLGQCSNSPTTGYYSLNPLTLLEVIMLYFSFSTVFDCFSLLLVPVLIVL